MLQLSQPEIDNLAESIVKKMEPLVARLVVDVLEEALSAVFTHLGHELTMFAKLRDADRK